MTARYVAYYRVSTTKQGRSGLGLEAQRAAVEAYAERGVILATYTEVETGKGANALDKRPQLRAALAEARKAKATLLIAKLDRLARNVAFIASLIEQKVPILAVDMPHADITMLHMFAVMAEWEGRMISERTKAALAAAKARGVILGTNGAALAVRNKAAAAERLQPLADQLAEMRGRLSLRQMASELGWHMSRVRRALAHI